MAIDPISSGEGGAAVRAKLNAAIAKANEVDGKATAAALSSETAARQAADATLSPRQDIAPLLREPGEAPTNWTAEIDEPAGAPDPLDATNRVVGTDGAVLRYSGAGIVASRGYYRIETGRIYKARFVVRRRVNSPDPSSDAVRCGMRWYDQAKVPLSGGYGLVEDLTDLSTDDGRVVVTGVISRASGDTVTLVAPSAARYGKPYVQFFGAGHTTDVEVIDLVDVTDAALYSPDLTSLESRLGAVESLDLGDRVETLESAVGIPLALTFPTIGDLEAATIGGLIETVELFWGEALGDGLGGTYTRTAPTGDVQSADGAWWTRINPKVLVASQAEAEAGVENTKLLTSLRTKQSIVANAKDGNVTQAGGGAVTRTIQAKLRDIVDIRDFGAVPSGGDDRAVFALAPADTIVNVPAGDYTLSSDLTSSAIFRFAKGVRILGGVLFARIESQAETYPSRRASLGEVITKLRAGTATRFYFFGDSFTYGADPSGALPEIADPGTGATGGGARALPPYPTAFLNSMLNTYGVSAPISVFNKAYPGGTSKRLLQNYDVLTDGASDVEFYMVGTNEPNESPAIGVAEYRRNLGLLAERGIARGAVVIFLLTPMPPTPAFAQAIRPYMEAMRQVAEEYRLLCIDCNEQVRHLDNRWSTDSFHLNARGYNELGSHLAALFINYDGDTIPRVASGRIFYPEDNAWIGGSFIASGFGRHGYLGTLAPAGRLSMGMFCEEDVYPIISTFNNTGVANTLTAVYTGSPGNAVPLIPVFNPGAGSARRRYYGPMLRRGYRTLRLLNDDVNDAFISSIEFVSAREAPIESSGGQWRSSRLGAQGVPIDGAVGAYALVDRSLRLRSPVWIEASVLLDAAPTSCGVLLAKEDTGHALQFPASCLYFGREGTSLIVDQYIGGTPTRLLGVNSIFPSGQFDGIIRLQYTGVAGGSGNFVFVVEGNLGGGAYTSSAIATNVDLGLWVHPGLMSIRALASDRGFLCRSLICSER